METIHDLRRRAPLHFFNRAADARACAWALWRMIDDPPDASSIHYPSSTSGAMHAGWERESSFAMESILKAAIAAQRQVAGDTKPPPASHDVGELWSLAGLPKPDKDDRTRLMLLAEMLYWSARYAAPLEGRKAEERMNAVARRAQRRTRSDGKTFIALSAWSWEHFDRMYWMANESFTESMERMPGGSLWQEARNETEG